MSKSSGKAKNKPAAPQEPTPALDFGSRADAEPEPVASLSPAQRTAVEHDGGPQIVLAGPGSGKTRVITHRVAHLINEKGVAPEQIVAVTFTVKAAEELASRLAELVGPRAASVNAHTFHGLGLRVLRRFPDEAGLPGFARAFGSTAGDIADSAQRRRLLRDIIREHRLFPEARALGVDACIAAVEDHIDLCDNQGLSDADTREFLSRARAALAKGLSLSGQALDEPAARAEAARLTRLDSCARAAALYRAAAADRAWLSFADLIRIPAELMRTSRRVRDVLLSEWRHWVVDEFQDVNAAQVAMLRAFAPPESRPDLTVVGDDDQSIYEFRGADDQAFARFQRIWTGSTVRPLTENHRSTRSIVAVAGGVIARATSRFASDKVLIPRGKHADRAVELVNLPREPDDADAIAALILTDMRQRAGARYADYAVVTRTTGDLLRVQAALELEGIPAAAQRSPSATDDDAVQRVLTFIDALVNPEQSHAIIRLLLRPPLSLPVEQAQRLARAHRDALREAEESGSEPLAMIPWLRAQGDRAPAAAQRLVAWFDDLARFDAEHPAADSVRRIISLTDAVHADLPSARDRARRVTALVALIGFVTERQSRLDEPGDLRAFWSYYQDLAESDRRIERAGAVDRVESSERDEPDFEPDAVRLVTAHSSKGLEFDTVFVPRVNPANGYPKLKADDRESDLPVGFIPRPGDSRSPKDRKVDEERRVFYVACTRAQRRLVLLAKKNKGRSSSTHFFEEIKFDPATAPCVVQQDLGDVYAAAAALNVGSPAAAWRTSSSDPAAHGDERDLTRSSETRDEVLARARRDARSLAARALDAADLSAGADPAASIEQAAAAARRIAITAHVAHHARPPAWLDACDAPTRDFAARLLAELQSAAPPALAADPHSTWDELVRTFTPRGPLTLSYSALSTYIGCPRCYLVQHIMNLPSPTGDEQAAGTIVHAVLQQHFSLLREADAEGRPGPTEADLRRRTREAYLAAVPPRSRDTLALESLEALALAALRLHNPAANIIEIEKPAEIRFGDHRVKVRIDRIDESIAPDASTRFTIIDYKTGAPSKSKLKPEKQDLQLCIYALALQSMLSSTDLAGQAEYWVLATGERGVLDFADMKLDTVRKKISEAINDILAGQFTRSSNDYWSHTCDVLGDLGT